MAKTKPALKKGQKKTKSRKIVKEKPKSILLSLKEAVQQDSEELKELFGSVDLAIFFTEWIANNRNATKAYAAMFPGRYDMTDKKQKKVAATLGSRLLQKVDISRVLTAYNLGVDRYLGVIDKGLKAKTTQAFLVGGVNDQRLETITKPDHETQIAYHTKLGKILKLESDKDAPAQNNTQVNINFGEALAKASKERGLEP